MSIPSKEDQLKALQLIALVRKERSGEAVENALKQLWGMSTNDAYKETLAHPDSGLLPVLVSVLTGGDVAGTGRTARSNAVGCLWYLSRSVSVSKALSLEPGLMEVLIAYLQSDADEGSILNCIKIFVNLALNDDCIQRLHSTSALPTIAAIVRREYTKRPAITEQDVCFWAMQTMSNFACREIGPEHISALLSRSIGVLSVSVELLKRGAEDPGGLLQGLRFIMNLTDHSNLTPEHIAAVVASGAPSVLFEKLKALGPEPKKWGSRDSVSKFIMYFFMSFAYVADGAAALKAMGGVAVLSPLLDTDGCEALMAAIAMAHMTGRDEASVVMKHGSIAESPGKSLLEEHPHLVDMLMDVFEAQLKGGYGEAFNRMTQRWGYLWAMFKPYSTVGALRVISISDANKRVLATTRVIPMLAELLQRFLDNLPPIQKEFRSTFVSFDRIGGGGADYVTAATAIEAIVQLSFFYDSEDELREKLVYEITTTGFVVEKKKMTVEELFEGLLLIGPPRALDRESRGRVQVLLMRLRGARGEESTLSTTAVTTSSAATADAGSAREGAMGSSGPLGRRQHVMLSYAWGAKKDLVTVLGAHLRSMGYDVWRDEEGSAIVPSMSGDTDERMAQAIESSHTVVVCVSPQYKESVNCRSEAQYCKAWKRTHGLQLMYVMMDDEYTTMSKTQTVDGWLGFMVGTELWYPLWAADKVQGTATELAKLIGDNAKCGGNFVLESPTSDVGPIGPTPDPTPGTPGTPGPPIIQVPTTPAPTNPTQAMWLTLHDSDKIKDSAGLTSFLSELGVLQADDLSVLEEGEIITLGKFLKPVQSRVFVREYEKMAVEKK